MSFITQYTPTYKLIDKTKDTVTPIDIEGDPTGNLLPFRSSCRISDIIGKAGTYNATLVLRSADNIFIDHGPRLTDELAKFKFLIDVRFFQPKDIGLPGQDNLGFKSRLFRFEISSSTIDKGRKGNHISLELTGYDVRLQENLDAQRLELFAPKNAFINRVLNVNTRSATIPAATGTVVLGTGSPVPVDQIESVTIVDGSRGHQFPPNVVFSDPTGTPPLVTATGKANIENGVVKSVTMIDNGDGYALSPLPTVTFTAPPKGPAFFLGDVDLPDDERLKQDWIPSKPTPTKNLLDEIMVKVSRPDIIGSNNEDFYHYTDADEINPNIFTVVAKKFGETDSGVTLQDKDTTNQNQTIEQTKQSDFNNRKYKNVLIARGKAATQTFPQDFGILSSDLAHARFASVWSAIVEYLQKDYVKFGFDRYKALSDTVFGESPASTPAKWENLSTSTKGTPWTIDPEVWIASMAGFTLNKISGGSGTGADIRLVVEDGGVIGTRIISGGIDFVNNESLTFEGTGTGAAGTAIVSGGVIIGVNITTPGINWFVGFFTDMNIARGNYDRNDQFDEFEKVSVKDIESFQFSTPNDIPSGEIATGRRWLVNGGTDDWAGQNQKIAQREGGEWKFSNAPVGGPTNATPRDIVNDLNLGRVLGFNGVSFEDVWNINTNPGTSSPFHPVESVKKVANRNGLNQAVEFTFNWNTFDLSDILSKTLAAVKISIPVGVPLEMFGSDLSTVTQSTTEAQFSVIIGKTASQLLAALGGSGSVKNKASRCLMWNIKLPFNRKKIKTAVKTYEVGNFIKKPLLDFENLHETIDKELEGWNNGYETQNLGNLRGLEWWQMASFLNHAGDPIDGLADLPFLLCFRDKFDTINYKEITQRSHDRWGKFRVSAGPNTGFKIFDSRVDELFTLLGFTFPDDFRIEQRELTGVKFDWRRVKEIMCIYKGSYDDSFFYKAAQNSYFDTFNEHATQYFKDLAVRFTISSQTGILDEENVIVDKAKIAVDDIHFIKDGYVSSATESEPDTRQEFVELPNQNDYINIKEIILPRLLSRKQFHPEYEITDCIGNVRLRAGQSFTLDDSTVTTPTKLTPIKVIHIDDSMGYHCQMTSLRKYEVT